MRRSESNSLRIPHQIPGHYRNYFPERMPLVEQASRLSVDLLENWLQSSIVFLIFLEYPVPITVQVLVNLLAMNHFVFSLHEVAASRS